MHSSKSKVDEHIKQSEFLPNIFVLLLLPLLLHFKKVERFSVSLMRKNTESTYHIHECLLKGKLFTCIMFTDLPTLVFSLSDSFICYGIHRCIPEQLHEQLTAGIIARVTVIHKNKNSRDLKKDLSQGFLGTCPSIYASLAT